MPTAKCTEVEPSNKNCHTGIHFKAKTVVTHAAKCDAKDVRKEEVLGLKPPLELDILQNLYYLRKGN